MSLCAANAELKVVVSIELDRDRVELFRLGLSDLSVEYLRTQLAVTYRAVGFEILHIEEPGTADLRALRTSWAKRLARSSNRSFIRILARAL